MSEPTPSLPHVVILGGGFGGLAAAKALRRAAVRVTLFDETTGTDLGEALLTSGAFSKTLSLSEGAHHLRARTIDAADAAFDSFFDVYVDLTAPTSSVNALPQRQNSRSFEVSVTGADPASAAGVAGSGVAFYDVYVSIDGAPPDLVHPPDGCPFAARCPEAHDRCATAMPTLDAHEEGREVACWSPFTAAR